MTLVQIYEIQTAQEAEKMVSLGVDHIGSVLLSADQWRDTRILDTIRTVQGCGAKSSLIPLFTDIDLISAAIEFYQPDIIHFCESLRVDSESISAAVERQQVIRRRFMQLDIMRSIPIARQGSAENAGSIELAGILEPFSDWFLTDTLLVDPLMGSAQTQPVDGYVGITGQTCDWDVAAQLVCASSIPVILAGGIGPDNVLEGVAKVNPAGVDSCTLTNAMDDNGVAIRFRKDAEKVEAMVRAVRKHDRIYTSRSG